MSHKRWVIADADKDLASSLSEKFNIDPFIAFLLVARGVSDDLVLSDFLYGSDRFLNPFSLIDMEKAVNVINDCINSGKKICVYGDYDADGVTSTALLFSFLASIGADVTYYIPKRDTEGYGMNTVAIDKIAEKGTDLIITVDTGISAFEESEYIYSKGMKLVVTDHHQVSDTLPRAEAVVNPHRNSELKFHDFAGVGVAFKLACGLFDGDTHEILEDYADLIAIGTIGDVVPLIDENRSLVKIGLSAINNSPRIGIQAFKSAINSKDKEFSSTDVAFQIVPRINVAGRLDDAEKALKMLISDDYEEALFLANQLCTENSHRQELEHNIEKEIDELIASNPNIVNNRVIVINGNDYHQGVIGIVASRILNKYSKPTIIISVDENGVGRGSCRSIDGFNIYEALEYCKDDLVQFGGHPLAAGFGIDADKIEQFRNDINNYALEKFEIMPSVELKLDCKLSAFYLNVDLVDSLSVFEPFGACNPQILFGLYNFVVQNIVPIGDNKHIRIEASKKGKIFKFVKFGVSSEDFPYKAGDKIDLAVKVSKNLYKGKYYLSIQALDVRLHGIDDDLYFVQKEKFERSVNADTIVSDIFPNRDKCVIIYKFLKSFNMKINIDDLYFRLQNEITFAQCIYGVKALAQAGLVKSEESIELNETNNKVDLNNTEIIKSLKGRLIDE